MSYDERGRLEALLRYTENLGFDAVYYTYNSMNAVTSVRVVDPQRQYTTWYGYNANGRMDSVWTKLSAVGTGLGITNPVYRVSESRGQNADIVYTYTKRWQVDKMMYPQIAAQIVYAYNGKMMLDSMVATRNNNLLFRQVLQYDSLDCITSQKWQHAGRNQVENTYVYNKHKWLEAAFETGGSSQAYYYDAVGNRTNYTSYGEGTTYSYTDPVGHNRLMKTIRYAGTPTNYYDTTNYSYNANGAVISKVSRDGIRTITETMSLDNIQGLLKKYTRTEGAVSEDWRYRSNAMGEREQKRLYSSTQTATKTWEYVLLSASKQQLAVYKGIETNQTSCGSTAEAFVYLYSTEYLTTGLGDVPNLTVRPQPGGTSKKEYKIQDYLGSTRVVLDGYGGVISQSDYKPYGEVSWQSGQTQRLSWIGKEKDRESSLGDFGARKYEDGKFLSTDPAWESYRSLTPYHYSRNNPLIRKDPGGLTDVNINIQRTRETNYITIGNLQVTNSANDKTVDGHTLERAWNDNKTNDSRIKAGTYDATVFLSPNLKYEVVRLEDKNGRTDVTMHPGSSYNATLGCICVSSDINNEDAISIGYGLKPDGKKKFQEMMSYINDIRAMDKKNGEKTNIIVAINDPVYTEIPAIEMAEMKAVTSNTVTPQLPQPQQIE